MSKQLSQKKLQYYLFLLQQTMIKEEKNLAKTIAFFDTHSFYLYYKDLICENGESIEMILNHIEHCIPLSLSQNSLTIFLEKSTEKNEMYDVALFLQSAKEDFLQVISYTKEDKESFADVFMMCESLRKKVELLR